MLGSCMERTHADAVYPWLSATKQVVSCRIWMTYLLLSMRSALVPEINRRSTFPIRVLFHLAKRPICSYRRWIPLWSTFLIGIVIASAERLGR
jgi:hypothetical protein